MLRSTPRMWTLKSLSSVPSNTVRPTPTMPGLTSSMGIKTVAKGDRAVTVGEIDGRDAASRPTRAAVTGNFMSL